MPGSFNHFSQIANALPDACAQIVDETADKCVSNIQARIRANGQVRTGNMLNQVHKEDGSDKTTKQIIAGATYSAFPNYGTRYQAARPFWEPGFEDTKPFFEERVTTLEAILEGAI